MTRINFGQKLLDDRWKASDQLIQLKGLVEFDERYRYWLDLKDEIRIEERDEELKRIAESVEQLRNLRKKHEVADYEAIEEVLKQDREIYLICRKQKPQDIIENLKQMIFRKKLAVDKTFYEVKKKEQELYDIESKIAICKDKMKKEEEIVKDKDTEEREKYSAALEYAKTQKDVCRITLDSYNKLLGILKNDSHYFDDLLDMLKEDSLVQSNAILRTMTLGQMLVEDFAWLKGEAKKHAISFNDATKQTRKSIKSIGKEIKQLDVINGRLRQYAANEYPLFQEPYKEIKSSDEEIELRTMTSELEEFKDQWKTCLNVAEDHDVFPKLLKLYTMQDEVLKRMENITSLKEMEEKKCSQLESVLSELDNCIDEDVQKNLKEVMETENEINCIAEEMQDLKKQEDEINKEMNEYKDIMYQFQRLLSHVYIGPPFGYRPEPLDEDPEDDIEAANRLRFENASFHLSTESEGEGHDKEVDIGAIGRTYLDPNIKLDGKQAALQEMLDPDECDPIKTFENVMMQMKTIKNILGSEEMSRDATEEELMGLGDFYREIQNDLDPMIEECMEQEHLNYKRYKPRYDDQSHKKSCPNRSRLEMKIESQKILLENEGPVVGVVIKKGALHPPGVIRGMFIPESGSEEEEDKGDEKGEGKLESRRGQDEEEEVEYIEEHDLTPSTSREEGLDSDLDPDQPKPHTCF